MFNNIYFLIIKYSYVYYILNCVVFISFFKISNLTSFKNTQIHALDGYYYSYNIGKIDRDGIFNDLKGRIDIDKKFDYVNEKTNLVNYYLDFTLPTYINFNKNLFYYYLNINIFKHLNIQSYYESQFNYKDKSNTEYGIPKIFLPRTLVLTYFNKEHDFFTNSRTFDKVSTIVSLNLTLVSSKISDLEQLTNFKKGVDFKIKNELIRDILLLQAIINFFKANTNNDVLSLNNS